MPVVTLSSGELHYIERGRGVPLVLLHANPGDSRDFEAIMPALAQHYRVLALDWPGYGASAMPPAGTVVDARFFYDTLCEFLAALALPPALIIGNSLGGNVAARLAIESRAKVRGLVLVSPGGFTPHNLITRAFCQLAGKPLRAAAAGLCRALSQAPDAHRAGDARTGGDVRRRRRRASPSTAESGAASSRQSMT